MKETLFEKIMKSVESINSFKSVIQHSRTSSGEKELTDINALADEYLRLAYHGLRAKDQSFNADFKTELDPDLPNVNVVPQDIGLVLLNLINNAFQAASSIATLRQAQGDNSDDVILSPSKETSGSLPHQPMVTVTTKNLQESIEIRVADNGPSIPDDIKDKIFQPFFTTKPTGEGTGLGLSMSYDIVTKGHGGKLDMKTQKGKGSEFIVELATTP